MSDNQQSLWKPVWLIAGQMIAITLLFSWLLPSSHNYWQNIDTWIFWQLHGTLFDSPNWQLFMAIANYRLTDLVPAILVLVIYLHFCFKGTTNTEIDQRLTYGLTIFILLLLSLIVFKLGTIDYILKGFELSQYLPRKSATHIFENVILLDELYPVMEPKVRSRFSFPGDHASVLFFFAVFISFYAGRLYGGLIFFVAILFAMPRLIGGAHWFSDVIVGAGYFVLISTSLCLATPIHKITSDKLHRPVVFITNWMRKNFYFIDKKD